MKFLIGLTLTMTLLAGAAHAATGPASVTASPPAVATPAVAATSKQPNAQQQKMSSCNADAGSKQLKGEARQTFMKGCLSSNGAATPAAAKPATPQERMKVCNQQAGDKKLSGDARKSFMSGCLKAA